MSIDPDYDREHETLHERNCRLQEEGAIAKLRSELAAANERVKELEETVTGLRGLDIQNESIIAASRAECERLELARRGDAIAVQGAMQNADDLRAQLAAAEQDADALAGALGWFICDLNQLRGSGPAYTAMAGGQRDAKQALAAHAKRMEDCAKEDKE